MLLTADITKSYGNAIDIILPLCYNKVKRIKDLN